MKKGSSITEDVDKTSFIRSRLVPGSRALNLIQTSAFNLTDIGSDYEQFKRSFMKVFGDGRREPLVKQGSHTIDTLYSNAASGPTWDGLVAANQLANDCVV